MKKKVLVVLIVGLVALVASGVSGLAQDDSDESMKGMKLVGTGAMGYVLVFHLDVPPSHAWGGAIFWITNPDCEESITIEQMSITRIHGPWVEIENGAEDGSLIYEGPLTQPIQVINEEDRTDCINNNNRVEVTTLEPHQQVPIMLCTFMPDGADGWLSTIEALNLTYYSYTVEIFWSGKGLPLIGHVQQTSTTQGLQPGSTVTTSSWSVPMVNMEQK